MIRIKDLNKVYKQGDREIQAVKDANIEVQRGEIFGVIGFSGAGKSTLLRCVNLLEVPTSGCITISGVEMTTLSLKELRAARRKIGMIFQHFNLLSSTTVFENIAAPLRLARTPQERINEKVRGLLDLVGLADKESSYPAQLSGGQKQRVAIARALANDPEMLLCDEATSALDPQTTDSILELLLDINRRFNITIMLITHEMHVIKQICDRVAVMEDGQVVEQGTVLDIFSNPRTETTQNFIKNTIDMHLPDNLLQKIRSESPKAAIIRISFVGEATTEPFIAELAIRYPLRPNIVFGNIIQIKETRLGNLIITVTGEPSVIAQGVQYLEQEGLTVEVLEGHVG